MPHCRLTIAGFVVLAVSSIHGDWTSAQIARFPERLVGFCSVNPVKHYAEAELARCAKDPPLRRELKLHVANSRVDYHNPEHIGRLRALFAAANGYRMAIIAHMRTSISAKIPYGAKGDPRTKNLYFDVTTVVLPVASVERLTLIARRLRQLGLQRILYGSDAAAGRNLPPREGWAAFRRLRLTEAEFRTIAGNVPPYMRLP